MKEESLVIPAGMDVYGVLIDSPDLLRWSLVTSNQNTLGIQVAEQINKYQVETKTFLYTIYYICCCIMYILKVMLLKAYKVRFSRVKTYIERDRKRNEISIF